MAKSHIVHSRPGVAARNPLGKLLAALTIGLLVVSGIWGTGITPAHAAESKPLNQWFTNPGLATLVAGQLGKAPTDTVSDTELATITTLSVDTPTTNVQSFTEFAPLQGLQTLRLQFQNMSDFEGVGDLPNLTQLTATNIPATSLNGLEEATGLTLLSIGYGLSPSFTDNPDVLAPIGELTALKELMIRYTSLSNTHFANVTLPVSIQGIDFAANQIETLEHLTHLEDLINLDLRDNKLTTVAGAEQFTKLRQFNVSNTNHGYGNNEAVFGIGTNSLTDFSPVSLTNSGQSLTLYLSNQSSTATFEYSAAEDLYIWELANVIPPTADNGTPTVVAGNLLQNTVLNNTLNRVELTPEHYAQLRTGSVAFTVYVRSQFSTVLGSITMYPAAPVLHTVEYTDGTGTEEAFPNQIFLNLTDEVATPQFTGTPTREGYSFEGWNPAVTPTVTQSVTYTAQWEQIPETYTVEYTDGVGNSAVFPDQVTHNLTAGTATPAFIGTPTRDGYTFTGWNPAVAPTVTENVTYTATWEPIPVPETYTVKYTDGTGAAEGFPNQITTDIAAGAATPAFVGTPNRTGYTFAGWNPAVEDTVTQNVTYTAQWEPVTPQPETYSVVYTDGTGAEAAFPDQIFLTIAEGTATPAFAGTPARDGYTFEGWNPAVADTVTQNVTYTAQWNRIEPPVETYTVEYTDGVGNSEAFADQVYPDLAAGTATPPFEGTPTRDGYTFTGWNPAVTDTVTENITYTATWDPEIESYTVEYTDGLGTSEAFADQVYLDLAPGTATPPYEGTPTRDGYTFTGWFPTVAATVTQNVTYTAQWELLPPNPETYTVSYTDGTGAEAAFATQTHLNLAEGTTTPAFEGTPTRTGYTFEGWNPAVADTVTQNVTYTAQWERVPVPGVTPPSTPPASKPGLATTGSHGTPELILLLAVAGLVAGGLAITARTRKTGMRG